MCWPGLKNIAGDNFNESEEVIAGNKIHHSANRIHFYLLSINQLFLFILILLLFIPIRRNLRPFFNNALEPHRTIERSIIEFSVLYS